VVFLRKEDNILTKGDKIFKWMEVQFNREVIKGWSLNNRR
jgi:hypothetical protein